MRFVLAAQTEAINLVQSYAGSLAFAAGVLIALLLVTLPHDRRPTARRAGCKCTSSPARRRIAMATSTRKS